jgi:hypothetical protein
MEQKLSFEQWMKKVDAIIKAKTGLVSAYLPDYCYADSYERGNSPRSCAAMAIRAAKEY